MRKIFVLIFVAVVFYFLIIPDHFSYAQGINKTMRRIKTPHPKQTPTWVISKPNFIPLQWLGIEAIMAQLLEGRNVYWSVLNSATKDKILIERLGILSKIVKFLQEECEETRDYKIITIQVKGSFIYGFEKQDLYVKYETKDLDLSIIVKGDYDKNITVLLDNAKKYELFGVNGRNAEKLSIKVFGEDRIIRLLQEGKFYMADRVMSDRTAGITIAGPVWYKENPPFWAWSVTMKGILDSLEEIMLEFQMNTLNLNERSDYANLLAQDLKGPPLSEAQRIRLAKYREMVSIQGTEFLRSVKRIIEANLRMKYFLENIRPDLGINIYLEGNIFLLPQILDDRNLLSINNIITKGVTEEFYNFQPPPSIHPELEDPRENGDQPKYIFSWYGVSDNIVTQLKHAYDYLFMWYEEINRILIKEGVVLPNPIPVP